MKNLKYILGIIGILLVAGGIYFYPKIQRALEIQEATQMDKIQHTFINMDKFFPIKEVKKSANPYQFPKGEEITFPETFDFKGITYNTEKYIDSSYTQGLLVLQNDTLVYEKYHRGQEENTRHISWSVAKSFVSALFGIAMEEGHIKSIEQTVDEYLPEMKGTGYEGVRIKDVLQMSSGVKFNEDYSDPNSDIQRWFKTFAFGDSQDEFATTLKNEKKPGTYNHYVSINTHVLGMIVVRATGKSLTEYLQEKIWNKLGMEHDAYWIKDNNDMEMALGGLNATLRDYAKMGKLFLNKGNWNGEQIVPADWVTESTTPDAEHLMADSKNSLHPEIGYGYQWWIPDGDDGEFMAIGVFNQFIYVNPSTRTVITKTSANENFYDYENPYRGKLGHLEMFRAIAKKIGKKEEIAAVQEPDLSE